MLWLNPQSWAVISGLADANQAEGAMDQVYTRLNTPYGAVLMDPQLERMVNQHHEEIKELHRRARQGGK